MNKSIETIRATRKNFLQITEGLSIDEVNKIPPGFNNNIIWNLGHIVVSQQILCYKLSNLPLKIDESLVKKYSKGTKPELFLDENEFSFLKEQAVRLIDEFVNEMKMETFKSFNSYVTSFGVELNVVDDSIKFITMHDGLHLGYAMALKKAIKQ